MQVEEENFCKYFRKANFQCIADTSGKNIGKHHGIERSDNSPRYSFGQTDKMLIFLHTTIIYSIGIVYYKYTFFNSIL